MVPIFLLPGIVSGFIGESTAYSAVGDLSLPAPVTATAAICREANCQRQRPQGKRDAIVALTTNVDQCGSARPVDDPAVANVGTGDGSEIGAIELAAGLHPAGAMSRKTQGPSNFDVNLPLTGTPEIECRNGGVTGDHRIIVSFANPITRSNVGVPTGMGP